MRLVSAVVLAVPLFAFGGKKPKAPPPTLCAAGEKVLANCVSTDRKTKVTTVASVCASKDLSADKGSMQFRMGPAGKPAQLTHPETPAHPGKYFRLRGHLFDSELRFSIGANAYLLEHMRDVTVDKDDMALTTTSGGKTTRLECSDDATISYFEPGAEGPERGPLLYGIPEPE